MKTRICLLAIATSLVLLPSCAKKEEVVVPPARDTIAIKYAATEVEVKEQPNAEPPVKARLQDGGNEELDEIKLGFGKFGWVMKTDLAESREEISSTEDNIRFRVAPEPVTSPGVRGQIIIEASVNTYGDVVGVRVKQNTTRRPDIEQQTLNSIKAAKFYPLMSEGKAKPFVYTYTASF